jgi:hypothetical protein
VELLREEEAQCRGSSSSSRRRKRGRGKRGIAGVSECSEE